MPWNPLVSNATAKIKRKNARDGVAMGQFLLYVYIDTIDTSIAKLSSYTKRYTYSQGRVSILGKSVMHETYHRPYWLGLRGYISLRCGRAPRTVFYKQKKRSTYSYRFGMTSRTDHYVTWDWVHIHNGAQHRSNTTPF